MSPIDGFQEAVARLREARDVQVREGLEYKAIVAARDEVIGRYQTVFSPESIGGLTEADFTSFLFFENNKHWTGLHRVGRQATKDMPKLRSGLRLLLDESAPLAERVDEAIESVHGMGKALASAILLVVYPDRYGVWNGVSEEALKMIGLWDAVGSGSTGQRYVKVNEMLLRLADALGMDLWTLDASLWALVTAKDDPGEEEKPELHYWKIAPGEHAWNWDACRQGGFITIGWEDFGDISHLSQDEFDARMTQELAKHDDWTESGAAQLWRFAHEVEEGDVVVANLGLSEVLGFGRVVGPYEFVSGERHNHHRAVEWFDTRRRALPEADHAFMRSLVPLTAERYGQLLALPPEKQGDGLAPPFDAYFANRAEADAAFDLFGEALTALAVTSNADERFAVTVSPNNQRLTLDYGPWCIVRVLPVNQTHRLQLAVLERQSVLAEVPVDFRFKEAPEDAPVVLRTIEPSALTPDVRAVFLETARRAAELFGHRNSCNWRKYHVDELGEALLDPGKRDALLAGGLTTGSKPQVRPPGAASPESSAFSVEARDLLVALTTDPTRAFCLEHKDELTQFVQEPLQRIVRSVATKIEPQLSEALETEKRLFGTFLKNDYGQGGAWPWYWGAFYPKGGKRSTGSQLHVSIDEAGVSYGFSIGDFASDDRKRFAKNATQHRDALVAALSETVSTPEFEFGKENASLGVAAAAPAQGLDLATWLDQAGGTGPQVYATVPWDRLLDLGHDQLVMDVTSAFNRLFPLVLLAIHDDPMEAIHAYMGGRERQDDPLVNPPYSLEALVAETNLPRELLRRWVRAIERKKQAVIYGPPGTGKTYVAERLAKHLVAGGSGETQTVQFHPAYGYEDFIQGIRPIARDEGGLDYPVVPGRFLRFCEVARNLSCVSVLIIDEINRANLARVFGELMYLLEYRDKSIPLAAGGVPFGIPDNVRIIGTMNTADRSIALVDHALRRRFAFLELRPDYDVLRTYHSGTSFDPSGLIEVLTRLNKRIADHHYEVGISFFLSEDLADELPDIWEMEIEPYLTEFFFDRPDAVDEFRWEKVAGTVRGV